jgi:septal ring factor EnvC (AmiA/AmiB activator)
MYNLLKTEFWERQWAILTSAPFILGPSSLIVGLIVWWVRGAMFKREISSWKKEISAVEQRLKLAADALAKADRDTETLKKEFQAYKAEVAAQGSNASPTKVDAAIARVAKGNTALRSEVLGALQMVGD